MNKQKLYWICQILGWGTYGIIQVWLFSVAGEIDQGLIVGEILQVLMYIGLTHLFRYTIIQLGWLNVRWYGLIPRIFLGVFFLSFLSYGSLLVISWFVGDIKEQDLNALTILASVFTSMALFIFWSLIYLSFHYVDRYNKSLQHEAALKEVELSNLRSQLNPHFIFNALNSIRALVDENPTKSKSAITQLSNILRNSLSTDRKKLVSFAEELKTVKDYLALESIRYEERLTTQFDIDPESYTYFIPPLMMQTLVENSIKHGISTLKNGGVVQIITRKVPEGLKLSIRNSGKFVNGKKSSFGYGLLNTRKRLELIYGEAAKFHIGNAEDEELVVTDIIIPNYI